LWAFIVCRRSSWVTIMQNELFVAGIDGFRGGWVAFKVHLPSRNTSVEIIDLPSILRNKPDDLTILAIDMPIGLLDGSRACDKAARRLLRQPRGTSVFAAPCRASLSAKNHATATATNLRTTGRGLSQQAWGIASKIKQVDDAITPECQKFAFEVHPEVCFWTLAGERPMAHGKKTRVAERLDLLRSVFPDIEHHLQNRPANVGKDDLLDAAVAAWTAQRLWKGEAKQVCEPERGENGLVAAIWY
jgi:predicted RNase H-like nuclease